VSAQRVGAVVVNYNSAAHLEVCLASLASEGVAATVVVDNGSRDGSPAVARAAGATWLETGANVGYGRAANAGARHPAVARLPWLLVCNPDVEITPGSVATLAATLEADETLGVVGPRISNPDGTLYPSARVFPDLLDAAGHGLIGLVAPRNRFTRRYRLLDWDHARLARVDWVSGACLMARRRAWEDVGGFDPRYFMYLEDVDLCWRLGRAGWGVAYQPAAEVVHVQGVSADRHPYRMLVAHHRSMWIFARRTTSGPRRLVLPAVLAGLSLRLAATVARRAAASRSRVRRAAAGRAGARRAAR
jgi:N-acetylglucosaminyl-diphospho-decaprenol L-rhamnosyltransferase